MTTRDDVIQSFITLMTYVNKNMERHSLGIEWHGFRFYFEYELVNFETVDFDYKPQEISEAIDVMYKHFKCLRKEYCPMDCNDCDLEMVPMDKQAEAIETILKYIWKNMEDDLK